MLHEGAAGLATENGNGMGAFVRRCGDAEEKPWRQSRTSLRLADRFSAAPERPVSELDGLGRKGSTGRAMTAGSASRSNVVVNGRKIASRRGPTVSRNDPSLGIKLTHIVDSSRQGLREQVAEDRPPMSGKVQKLATSFFYPRPLFSRRSVAAILVAMGKPAAGRLAQVLQRQGRTEGVVLEGRAAKLRTILPKNELEKRIAREFENEIRRGCRPAGIRANQMANHLNESLPTGRIRCLGRPANRPGPRLRSPTIGRPQSSEKLEPGSSSPACWPREQSPVDRLCDEQTSRPPTPVGADSARIRALRFVSENRQAPFLSMTQVQGRPCAPCLKRQLHNRVKR